jgi:hypothetical protein
MSTQAITASIASRDLAQPPVLRPEQSAHRPGGWRRHAVMLTVVALLTGGAWMSVIPPFEGTDELYFYNRARDYAAHPERREGLFYRLAAPIIRAMTQPTGVAAPEYNPAFQFVGNARGEVNRFVHDRPVASREHVRTLMAIRGLVVGLAAATALMIYAMARLSLGDGRMALLVAGICLWIPQSSFANATVHAEALTRLIAAAVTLAIVARVTGRLPRALAWMLLLPGIALVPFADRQALFLAPFAAIGLVATERRWWARAVAGALVIVPTALAAWIVTRYTEYGTDLSPWIDLAFHPLRPFAPPDPARGGALAPNAAYYAFEFLPKLFMGFWGWMGQPSILLPAWTYAALAALTALALTGLVLRLWRPAPASDDERQRLTSRRLMALGVVLMCVPIVYGPAIAGLNLWYGRWLFAMIGPIVIGLVIGLTELVLVARRSPHRVALALGGVVVCATALWLAAPGSALRAGIAVHHYGDRARLIDSLRDTLAAFAMAALAIEVAALVPSGRFRVPIAPALCGAAAVNALVLIGFLRPLYAPLDSAEYVTLISGYVRAHDIARAADVYASAVKSYPESRAIRALADQTPPLLLGGTSAASRALLWEWLARGNALRDRDALLMLASEVRSRPGNTPRSAAETLNAVVVDAERDEDLAEPAALLRLALAGGAADRDAGRTPIDAGHGRRIASPVRKGEIVIEGFTTHPAHGGRTQLVVYFRPRVNGDNRRLWVHAYPVGSPAYLEIIPRLAPAIWTPGEIGWAMFELPPGAFTTYVGAWTANDLGDSAPLGVIP